MKYSLVSIALVAEVIVPATAFPFVVSQPGVDSSLLARQQPDILNGGDLPACPYTPWSEHVPAVGISDKFPYNGAKDGKAGKGVGGYQVPADGDTDHEFRKPGPGDIRGPCPGLNAAANHGFLARDGITTYNELVDAQQNMYNMGHGLAVLLASLSLITQSGDQVTERVSIGCDATNRTSRDPAVTGPQPGLNGHNRIEGDTSLTRNDYYLGNGDNVSFNGTLFKMMTDVTGGVYNREGMAKYRYLRYQESLRDNPNFYFGPLTMLLYGAASFLYEIMPSGTNNYAPDKATIMTFFGVTPSEDGSTYVFNNDERLPANYVNRVKPYDIIDMNREIIAQYNMFPVPFHGTPGPDGFDVTNIRKPIENGKAADRLSKAQNSLADTLSQKSLPCMLYQLMSLSVKGSPAGFLTPALDKLTSVISTITPGMQPVGCDAPPAQ
ncbi:hypothetical protein LZ554_001128 [Drepanopeziza brunnea f. sp. 'monogermtubi']|nr:hypothetical protein LZ554_001128 [Drepanopeziza brunnea f. sp. 'monogermtubi']